MNELIELSGDIANQITIIEKWYDDAKYIEALSGSIVEQLEKFSNPSQVHILFSAHSVPVRYIEEGDPYLDQTKATVEKVMERIGGEQQHSLSFQSKVGPVKWLRPSTDEMIRTLAKKGIAQLLLVPVSFVSEHIETLYELDILYRDVADDVGILEYRRVPALNCRPDFVKALASLVEKALDGEQPQKS